MVDEAIKYIDLSGRRGRGRRAIVDAVDYDWLVVYRWHLHSEGYASRWINDEPNLELMHRAIMNPPDGYMVDHVNGNKLDNRRSNLRLCTRGENGRNSASIGGTSRFKGVWQEGRRWRVALRHDGKKYYLGRFDSEIDAARAYDKAARHHFGAFARLNFPDE